MFAIKHEQAFPDDHLDVTVSQMTYTNELGEQILDALLQTLQIRSLNISEN